MELKDVFERVRKRVQFARARVIRQRRQARERIRSLLDTFGDERMEQAFRRAREMLAPSPEFLPLDLRLRRPSLVQRVQNHLFPVTHVLHVSSKFGREFLDDFMPLSNDAYIGRGSYKFVYRLPWRMVLKISKRVLPSDPLFGSLYREVATNPHRFLTPEELELMEFLGRRRSSLFREKLAFKFHRLGLERYNYWKVQKGLGEMVLPTRFFMGMAYRKRLFGEGHLESLTPMDKQIMLVGKHLKEFASAGRREEGPLLLKHLFPKYEFEFNGERMGKIKKRVLQKIIEDFRRLIKFTEELAVKEGLILDIHTENIIVTLPEFELKVFDFHIFDEHLYEPVLRFGRPEQDHIEVIERFVESLRLYE